MITKVTSLRADAQDAYYAAIEADKAWQAESSPRTLRNSALQPKR